MSVGIFQTNDILGPIMWYSENSFMHFSSENAVEAAAGFSLDKMAKTTTQSCPAFVPLSSVLYEST